MGARLSNPSEPSTNNNNNNSSPSNNSSTSRTNSRTNNNHNSNATSPSSRASVSTTPIASPVSQFAPEEMLTAFRMFNNCTQRTRSLTNVPNLATTSPSTVEEATVAVPSTPFDLMGQTQNTSGTSAGHMFIMSGNELTSRRDQPAIFFNNPSNHLFLDDNNISSRLFPAQSLPSHIWSINGIKCPVCNKTLLPHDIEYHLVMCLSKPRLSYNEDILQSDKGECVICLEELIEGSVIARLPCLCIYHKKCIDQWFKVNRSCPEHPGD